MRRLACPDADAAGLRRSELEGGARERGDSAVRSAVLPLARDLEIHVRLHVCRVLALGAWKTDEEVGEVLGGLAGETEGPFIVREAARSALASLQRSQPPPLAAWPRSLRPV